MLYGIAAVFTMVTATIVSVGLNAEPANASGATYYVSSSAGNDANAGTSSDAPWQTISKLNSITFQPGDNILLRSGDTWTGQTFYPSGNGDAAGGDWITLSSYGAGAAPVLSPGTSLPAAIQFSRSGFTGGWKIVGLDIRNARMGIDAEKTPDTVANGLWIEKTNFENITGNNIGAGTNSVSVAHGATVSSSSSMEDSDWGANRATDGNTQSVAGSKGWTSDSNLTTNHVEWVSVDLGSTQTLTSVVLHPRSDSTVGDGFPHSFTIDVSTDGINWTTVVTKSNYTVGSLTGQIFGMSYTAGRYVRVTGTDLSMVAGLYRMQFAEVAVFSTDEASGFNYSVWCSEGVFTYFVDNVTIKDSTFSYSDLPFDIRTYQNATIDNVTVDHTFRGGMWFSVDHNYPSSNLLVKNSRVLYAGFRDGMWWGIAGIQLNGGSNLVIQDTEVAYTQAPNNSPDGVGIDVESDTVDAIIQRNYIHDNARQAFLIMENPSWGHIGLQRGTVIRSNVISNNGLRDPRNEPSFIKVWSHNENNNVVVSDNTITNATAYQKLNWMHDLSPNLTDEFPTRFSVSGNSVFGPVDLALNRSVTASSSLESSGWGSAALVDGNTTSGSASMGWTSNSQTNVDHTEFVQVDLGSSKPLREVVMYPRSDGTPGDGFPIDFSVQVSSDGLAWTTVVTESGYDVSTFEPQAFSFATTDARYVRVVGTRLKTVAGLYYMQFAELEVYAPANLALDRPVSSSSSTEGWGWGEASLTDGLRSSLSGAMGWSSSSNTGTDHSEWVSVDLGNVVAVGKVVLSPRTDGTVGDGFPKTFTVEVSTDGVVWTSVSSQSGYALSSVDPVSFVVGSVNARYIRITGTVLSPVGGLYYMQFGELEVY